jgi:transmembrane sensor
VTPEIRQAFTHVHEPWSPSRIAMGKAGLEKKRVRRRVVRGTLLTTSALAVAALIITRLPARESPALTERVTASATMVTAHEEEAMSDGALLLTDGSFAEPLGPDTALAVEADETDHVQIALLDGGARFDVVPNAGRKFVVVVRGVRVEVIGTRFEVALEGSRVHVRVQRGHVRVTWGRGRRDLLTQQSGLFPIDETTPSYVTLPEVSVDAPALARQGARDAEDGPEATAARSDVTPGDWRRLAREGDYESAYQASRGQAVGTGIDDLWLAADAARLSRHPREAVSYLEQALALHPGDRRVHLAAFTLGRLHLQLGQPRQAALDFARVEQLDRGRVLVEQALAREVEAWARAGDAARARDRAAVYLRRFPTGTYAERVRRFSSPP